MNNIPKGYKQTEAGVIPEEWELRSGLKITERISKGASPNALGQPKSLAWFDIVWNLCNGPLHKYLGGASSPCLIKFKLEPGHLSQLGFYLSVVDEILRHPDDQPTDRKSVV